MSERRVTRSMSSEHQGRLSTQTQHPHRPHDTYHSHYNGYAKGLSGLINEAELSMKDPQFSVLRNTSEELLIRSLVEGIPTPSMEGIGFTNLPQANRVDSEELFHTWMSHGEGQNAGPIQGQNRSRQSSRRMFNDFTSVSSQQHQQGFNRVDSFDQFLQTNNFFLEDAAGENRARDMEGDKVPSPLKSIPWFAGTRPMTRSRSSELRRHYAAMQGNTFAQTDKAYQIPKSSAAEGALASTANRRVNHIASFPQANQSAMAPLHAIMGGESVSSFVTLLKGTLERKKLGKGVQQQRQLVSDSRLSQRLDETFQNRADGSLNQVSNPSQMGTAGPMHYEGYGQVQSTKQILSDGQKTQVAAATNGLNGNHSGFLTHAPSPSESSVGAPVLSTGEEPCNSAPSNSVKRSAQQNIDVDQQPKRQNSIVTHPSQDIGDNIRDTVQVGDHTKSPHLNRVGSVTSSGGSGMGLVKDDPTKKRRVERQRKMAEAKGRNGVPVIPSDLQATLKRCDALEKEVRSLKLNLAFMNRKDSEQTKQIEELQKQNEDLQKEKEKLLEEIEQLTDSALLA